MSITSTKFRLKPHMACAPKVQPPQVQFAGNIVYFVRIRETGEIKIGTTGQWERRVEGLQRQYGDLTLLATEPGSVPREREIHAMFPDERAGRSEVFLASDAVMRYIEDVSDSLAPIIYEGNYVPRYREGQGLPSAPGSMRAFGHQQGEPR